MSFKINCSYTKLLPVSQVIPNDRNTNKHPEKQIKLLAKIIDYQGWRHPIIISNLSGQIVAGHGRLAAAKLLNMPEVPVDFQDFENKAQEIAFLESDNLVADLAEHDKGLLLKNIKDLELNLEDFDIELFGIDEFQASELFKEDGELDNLLSGSDVNSLEDRLKKYEETQPRKIILTFEQDEFDHFKISAKKIIQENNLENYKELFQMLVSKYEYE